MGTQNPSPTKLKLLPSQNATNRKHPKLISCKTQSAHFPFFTASPLPTAQIKNPSMRALSLLLFFSLSLIAITSGYQWEPVHSDSFPWRPCSSFEATKKNCPKGEPCMADLSYAGYVPNNALKCQRSRDRLLEQYQNAKIG